MVMSETLKIQDLNASFKFVLVFDVYVSYNYSQYIDCVNNIFKKFKQLFGESVVPSPKKVNII